MGSSLTLLPQKLLVELLAELVGCQRSGLDATGQVAATGQSLERSRHWVRTNFLEGKEVTKPHRLLVAQLIQVHPHKLWCLVGHVGETFAFSLPWPREHMMNVFGTRGSSWKGYAPFSWKRGKKQRWAAVICAELSWVTCQWCWCPNLWLGEEMRQQALLRTPSPRQPGWSFMPGRALLRNQMVSSSFHLWTVLRQSETWVFQYITSGVWRWFRSGLQYADTFLEP